MVTLRGSAKGDDMIELLTITPVEVIATIVSTIGMYLVMVVLIRVLGQRLIASLSSFDLAAVITFGAIIGRAALGDRPRLTTGVVALCTLVLIQPIVGGIRATRLGARIVAVRPILLMAGSRRLEANLRRCHVSDAELRSRLRIAGVRHPHQIAAVIFEYSGAISILRPMAPCRRSSSSTSSTRKSRAQTDAQKSPRPLTCRPVPVFPLRCPDRGTTRATARAHPSAYPGTEAGPLSVGWIEHSGPIDRRQSPPRCARYSGRDRRTSHSSRPGC